MRGLEGVRQQPCGGLWLGLDREPGARRACAALSVAACVQTFGGGPLQPPPLPLLLLLAAAIITAHLALPLILPPLSCSDDVLPCRVYLRHCVLAAQRLGFAAYASFLDGTWLSDRRTTVRQYLAANPDIMDELPPASLIGRYSG